MSRTMKPIKSGGFTLLWESILHSSIWVKESKETRLVWVTLLAKKDSQGRVTMSEVGLADLAKVTPAECKKSLEILLSPDKDDTSGVEEGRRLRKIPGGWEIVNHDDYRFSTEEKREFWRDQKRQQRARAIEDAGDIGAEERKRRVAEKIAREEAMEAEVREEFNPEATGERAPVREGEEGLTAREIVRKRVSKDPSTKADKAAMKANKIESVNLQA